MLPCISHLVPGARWKLRKSIRAVVLFFRVGSVQPGDDALVMVRLPTMYSPAGLSRHSRSFPFGLFP